MLPSRLGFGLAIVCLFVLGANAGRDGFSAQNLTAYGNSQMLSSKFKLMWDGDAEWIHVAMVVETQGWVAIGIAEPTSGRYASCPLKAMGRVGFSASARCTRLCAGVYPPCVKYDDESDC